jgi:hypothetical protein
MTKSVLCVSILALVVAAAPVRAGAQTAKGKQVSYSASTSSTNDCETRIQKLEASQAEGAERLAEKEAVIDRCAGQYKRDKTIARLVNECEKYQEQPVVKRQSVAECQLAAFNYANALRTLKAWYRK